MYYWLTTHLYTTRMNSTTRPLLHEEESSFHSKAAAHLPFEYVKDDPSTPSASNSSNNNNDHDSTRTGGRKLHPSNSRSSLLLTLTLAALMLAVASVHSPAALIIASSYKRNIFCQAKTHGDNGGIWNWFFCVRTVAGSEDDGTDDDITEDDRQRRALSIVNDETVPSVDGDLKESLSESESLDYKASLQPQHGQHQLQLNHQESQAEFSSSLNYVAAPADLQKEENKELSSRQNDVTSPLPFETLGQAKVYLPPAVAAAAAGVAVAAKRDFSSAVPVVTNYPVAFSGHEKDGYDYYFYLYDGNEHDHDNLDGAFLETEQGEHLNMEQVDEGEVYDDEDYDHDDHDMVDGEWYYFDENGSPVDEHGYYLDDYDDYEDEEEDGDYEDNEDYDEDEDEEWEEWEDEVDADDESNENGD